MDFKGVLKKFISLNSMHLNEKLWKRESMCISIQCTWMKTFEKDKGCVFQFNVGVPFQYMQWKFLICRR